MNVIKFLHIFRNMKMNTKKYTQINTWNTTEIIAEYCADIVEVVLERTTNAAIAKICPKLNRTSNMPTLVSLYLLLSQKKVMAIPDNASPDANSIFMTSIEDNTEPFPPP
jgi:hypothetical protein